MLSIDYKTNKLKKECTEFSYTKKIYGERMAIIIHQRVNEIMAASSIEMLVQFSIGR